MAILELIKINGDDPSGSLLNKFYTLLTVTLLCISLASYTEKLPLPTTFLELNCDKNMKADDSLTTVCPLQDKENKIQIFNITAQTEYIKIFLYYRETENNLPSTPENSNRKADTVSPKPTQESLFDNSRSGVKKLDSRLAADP